jgi:hypothetical protein
MMRKAYSGMSNDRAKENFPDSQISPLKLENASPMLQEFSYPQHFLINDSEILSELKNIRSELSESMHKLKVLAATSAAGIPNTDSDSFDNLFLEIAELVARMSVTETKAGAALKAKTEQVVSQHELRNTVLRGFENDLVIDGADNSLFITRKANLISVIHEHAQKSCSLFDVSKSVSELFDSTAPCLERSRKRQLEVSPVQITSLQLDEQINQVRMAAGN